MNIIHMIDNFSILCKEANHLGNYEAYRQYTMKYPELFDGILNGLYMTNLENLEPMISAVNLQQNLNTARMNYESGLAQKIVELVEKVASLLSFQEGFDVYLGLELGNIGGFVGPNWKERPYLYIGLDRVIDNSFLKYIIPHEMNHMVRVHANKHVDMFDFMERTITEGLGSMCPLVLYNMEYDITTISSTLSLPEKDVSKLVKNRSFLISKITEEFGTLLNQGKMAEYFTWSAQDSDKYYLSGYFVGMEIIKALIDEGYDFEQLTVMPSKLIWKYYQSIFN